MKIIVAPDAFKGSLSSESVCHIIKNSILETFPEATVTTLPVSDGGEGLVDCLLNVLPGKRITASVHDPLGRPITAEYALLEDKTAVIEMAAASGLPLLSEDELNPMKTSTFGTGELIYDALNHHCKKIILGIGGSATVDGGSGMANALGMTCLNDAGHPLEGCGVNLSAIAKIDSTKLDSRLLGLPITIACDVDNPLCGEVGSAAVYGPQKGATPDMIQNLDQGLSHFCRLLEKDTDKALSEQRGIGAAGGIALPLISLCNAELKGGLEIVLDALSFDTLIQGADCIITGEGKTDYQSAMGKVLSGVCRRGKQQGIPVFALPGALEPGYEALYAQGLTAAFATCTNTRSLDFQMAHAAENLKAAADNLMQVIKTFR